MSGSVKKKINKIFKEEEKQELYWQKKNYNVHHHLWWLTNYEKSMYIFTIQVISNSDKMIHKVFHLAVI